MVGIGRGAMLSTIGCLKPEEETRRMTEETVNVVKAFLSRRSKGFAGRHFTLAPGAHVAKPGRTRPAVILGSCNAEMAFIAGKLCDEFQTGENFSLTFLRRLYEQMKAGAHSVGRRTLPRFSIGGVSCISKRPKEAYDRLRPLLAIYLPHLRSIIEEPDFPISGKDMRAIEKFTGQGRMRRAAALIPDSVVELCALAGSPEQAVETLRRVRSSVDVFGLSLGPPYGTLNDITKNLQLIRREVLDKL